MLLFLAADPSCLNFFLPPPRLPIPLFVFVCPSLLFYFGPSLLTQELRAEGEPEMEFGVSGSVSIIPKLRKLKFLIKTTEYACVLKHDSRISAKRVNTHMTQSFGQIYQNFSGNTFKDHMTCLSAGSGS